MKQVRFFWLFLLFTSPLLAQQKPLFLTNHNKDWVENTLASLTLEQKIGQLLMPRGNTSGKGYQPEKLKEWVEKYQVGGFVFFAGQPTRQAQIVNELQALSKVPLLIGMDLEWGLAMRLDSTVRFPYQMALGAMQGNEDLLYRMGQEVAKQSKRMGVHVNYAPVVDVNNNPANPVINFRSFGENREDVMKKALAYMKGMESERLLTSAKHFPGHGDTGVDSHYDLPVISHDKKRLKEIELYPFQQLIDAGISGIMTAHLSIPQLDNTPNLASTLSSKIVTDLLRKDMKFEGLVFTDAMDMQGAVKYFPNGEALVKAILAGNDILETFEDVPTAVEAIKTAIKNGKLSEKILNERVRKILQAKSWVGLDKYQPIETKGLIDDLNTTESDLLNRLLAEKTVTVVQNTASILPIQTLNQSFGLVSLDASSSATLFAKRMNDYVETTQWVVSTKTTDQLSDSLLAEIKAVSQLVIAVHLSSIRPYGNYGVTEKHERMLRQLHEIHPNAVVVVLGNPYALGKIPVLREMKTVVLTSQLTNYMEDAAVQGIFGAIPLSGKLPVTVDAHFVYGMGEQTAALGRLAYGIPEMVGIDGTKLRAGVDSVLQVGLMEKAYPGAVMQIAKEGRVIYQKAVGYHTFEAEKLAQSKGENGTMTDTKFETGTKADVMDGGKKGGVMPVLTSQASVQQGKVQVSDLYDLASVTKISTSALAVMQLMSENKFSLDATLGSYYPAFKGSNKENLTFRDMLTHRSGLKAWIPFWMDCIDTVATLRNASLGSYIAEERWVKNEIKRTFFQKLIGKKKTYLIDYKESMRKDKKIWLDALHPETIAWKPGIFSPVQTAEYTVEVTDSLWLRNTYREFILNQIKESPVKPTQGYVYSDLHYYLYPEIIKNITGEKWEDYLKKTYRAIGATTLTYNPRKWYSLSRIVPTEVDTLFRKTLIHGRVHDEGAGLLAGISGHAGLFGNANDLMKLMQMYLQKGEYGGQRFIASDVLAEATKYQFPEEKNRRAIAFDKLDFNPNVTNGPRMASPESYGHSGFTGTFTWIDPASQLVYVFLSNRVYPTRDNGKISSLNIRTAIGDEIYKAMKK